MYSYMKVSPRRERSCILTWRFHHTVKGYVFLHEDFTIPWKAVYSYMEISLHRERLCILTWRFHHSVKGYVFLHEAFTTPWKAMYSYMELSRRYKRMFWSRSRNKERTDSLHHHKSPYLQGCATLHRNISPHGSRQETAVSPTGRCQGQQSNNF